MALSGHADRADECLLSREGNLSDPAPTRKSAETFNRAMTSFSTVEAPAIAEAYDFSRVRSLTDIGGGHGFFLATILERYPDMNGTLFELPQVVHGLAGGPLEPFKNRVRVVEGDMFKSIPPGADAYIMKRIVHDWPDEHCGKILSLCEATRCRRNPRSATSGLPTIDRAEQ